MDYEPVLAEMRAVFAEIPYGIEHTMRVLANAEAILIGVSGDTALGDETALGDRTALAEVVTLAAILHDIGAPEALRKYGSIDGPYQEKEGPPIARRILEKCGYSGALAERVCFIVGHHHSPEMIDGLDFQILYEADQIEAKRG